MCVRNRTLNYSKLLNAIKVYHKQYEDTVTCESELRVYVMLMKVNYLYSKYSEELRDLVKKTRGDKIQVEEIGSEFSSEAGLDAMIDEEKEREFKNELQLEIGQVMKLLEQRIVNLEITLIKEALQDDQTALVELAYKYV